MKTFKIVLTLFLFLFILINQSFSKSTNILVLEVRSEINPSMNRYVKLGLEKAISDSVDMVIIDMDTYGGAVLDADEIRSSILDFKIPIHVFINKNAGSAGSLISIACDSIFMSPGSIIGATSVVNQNGEIMPEKIQSYMRTMMKSTAESKGRDTTIAMGMVGFNLHTDSAKVIALSPKEAISKNYCEGQVNSLDEVISTLGIKDYKKNVYVRDVSETIISYFLNPVVKSILVMMIFGGIYFELKTPGIGFPLALAIIGLLGYFLPDYLYGFLEIWELLLFIVGFLLIVLEIFVIPGFGIAGISGITLVLSSFFFSMIRNDGFDFTFVSNNALSIAFMVLCASMFGGTLVIVFGAMAIVKSQAFKKLTVQENITGTSSGEEFDHLELIGQIGKTQTPLMPSGKVMIGNKLYDAQSKISFIDAHKDVVVISQKGATFVVKEV